jgi:uncharacterized protein
MRRAPELFAAHVREIQRDLPAWRELYAPAAVMEFPYGAAAGVASPLRGIDAVARSVAGFLDNVRDFAIVVGRLYVVQGEDAVLAEFTATATVISTGRAYDQAYILYLRAENGFIVELREYFDATRVIAAFRP